MCLENEDPEQNLEEMEEEIIEMSREAAFMMIEDHIGYRPKTGNNLWVMAELLKEKRKNEASNWQLVKNSFGWFHIVLPEDVGFLEKKGYSHISIKNQK